MSLDEKLYQCYIQNLLYLLTRVFIKYISRGWIFLGLWTSFVIFCVVGIKFTLDLFSAISMNEHIFFILLPICSHSSVVFAIFHCDNPMNKNLLLNSSLPKCIEFMFSLLIEQKCKFSEAEKACIEFLEMGYISTTLAVVSDCVLYG